MKTVLVGDALEIVYCPQLICFVHTSVEVIQKCISNMMTPKNKLFIARYANWNKVITTY